jgi:hypothetical protein
VKSEVGRDLFHRSENRLLEFERFVLEKMFFGEKSKTNLAEGLVVSRAEVPLDLSLLVGGIVSTTPNTFHRK